MSTLALLGIGAGSIALLLLLIIRWQVHAFVAMMLVSFLVAFATGMPISDIISTLIAGMGGTLGSVAILVALGSMLGRMIEVAGGAASLANRFTQLLGPTRVPMALTAAALVLAIPVFFDVGFIILVPIVYGFCKAAGVNPIKFGLPVAGIMLAAHVVVPPHPGIVGGAAIVKGDIGWITIIGLAICIPLAALAQVVAGWLNRKGYPMLPTTAEQFAAFGNTQESTDSKGTKPAAAPGVGTIMALILIPLALIMAGTTGATLLPKGDSLRNVLGFIGSPIFALMVAVGLAMYLLGRNQGWNRERTNAIMESALPPRCHRDPGDGRGRRVCQGAHRQRHWRGAFAKPHRYSSAAHPAGVHHCAGPARCPRLGHRGHHHHLRPAGRCDGGWRVFPLASGAAHGCHWLWQPGPVARQRFGLLDRDPLPGPERGRWPAHLDGADHRAGPGGLCAHRPALGLGRLSPSFEFL